MAKLTLAPGDRRSAARRWPRCPRHLALGLHDGRGAARRALERGRRPLRLPAGDARDLRRRRAEAARTVRLGRATACAARRSSRGCARRVTTFFAVKFLLRFFQTNTADAVRHLLHRAGHGLHAGRSRSAASAAPRPAQALRAGGGAGARAGLKPGEREAARAPRPARRCRAWCGGGWLRRSLAEAWPGKNDGSECSAVTK